ncbi:hypothetical protein [Qipengyuania nanhaisediminis]|uniref:hypothetical protein n=1 Tax=Qipengyuania nanhaisediminis TaxID=604088 RepID=UPI0038B39EE4
MKNLKRTLTKGALGTVAAGAMALATATPAVAGDRYDRDRVDAGDVIAGAVVIGGIAALLGAFDNDDRRDHRYRDRRYRDRDYRHDRRYRDRRNYRDHRGYRSAERAIERCVRVAERRARRQGGWRYADVTQIRDVDRTRYGFKIEGRMEVQGSHRYRRNYDRGAFTCYAEGGRPRVRFGGIRGLG